MNYRKPHSHVRPIFSEHFPKLQKPDMNCAKIYLKKDHLIMKSKKNKINIIINFNII